MLTLSPKHGVNPSVGLCFFCQKAKEVLLFGRMKGDEQAPREVVANMEPCDECAGLMKQGIILISVDPAQSEDKTNPWRSGGWCVVRAEALERWKEAGMDAAVVDSMLDHRFGFIEDQVWDLIGLPRAEAPSTEEAPA
jgi:hypothetical protein